MAEIDQNQDGSSGRSSGDPQSSSFGDREFWDEMLEGVPQVAGLPCDGKPDDRTPARTVQLREVAPGEGSAIPESLIVAAVALVLGHYGQGYEEVVIGVRTPRMPEALPLRLRISDDLTGEAFLDAVAAGIAGLEQHLVPLAWLLDHYPAFSTRWPLHEVAIDFADSGVRVPAAEVVVRVTATSIRFHRSERAVTAGRACRFSDHVKVVSRALSTDDRALVGDISPLTAAERDEILVGRNQTAAPYRRESTLPELVDEQARANPDAVAVTFDGDDVTYRELVARANRLAHQITRAAAESREPVGVCVHRDINMVVAKLAVLKTGAPYVPLDPDEPDQRLKELLRVGGISLAVVSENTSARLRSLVTIVEVSRQDELPGGPMASEAAGGDPAIMLFTSGSTGEPKAVWLTHRAITRIADNPSWIPLGTSDVVSQSSHLAFDWCAYQIWGALINGARLVVVPQGALLSPYELSRLVETEGINTLCLTTALFHELAGRSPATFAGVDRLMIAGERLRGAELRQVLEQGPPRQVYNLYGPTENGVFTTFHECSMSDIDAVPIGRPVPNTVVYILDHRRRPVADGVVGDLYVGGDGLSTGYRGRPDLTGERFIPNPFDPDVNQVIFDSGDRSSYRPDGVIEFHGRRDFQVKIRGFRIEPGEVETHLGRCTDVRQAAVIPSEDSDTNRHLIAFVVPADGAGIEIQEIRRRLRKSLPAAAVPGRFLVVEELPLNARGKIDRARLTELAAASTAGGMPPRDDIVIAVTALWRDVLEIPDVEPDDDFFAIGGDSRLVMELVHRVNALFAIEIEPVTLFESPTVAGFAEVIRGLRDRAETSGDNGARPARAPLSWQQESLWDTCTLAAGTPLYNESFTLAIHEVLDVESLVEALKDLTRRHPALRTGFVETGGRTVQQVADVDTLPFTRTDLSGMPAGEQARQVELLGVNQARLPFALDRPPLARAQLIQLRPDDHRLHIIAHHLVCDGISFSHALVHDLHALYKKRVDQAASAPPPPSIDYLDYSRAQREQGTAAQYADELRRVADELRGSRPTELPLLQARPPISSFRGARRTCRLPADAVEKVRNLSRRHKVTPTLVLFSIFQIALHSVTQETDLVTGLVQDTRSRPELDDVCGTFVNTTPLRCDLSGDPTYGDVLARTHRAYVSGQALRGIPLSLVEQHLAGEPPAPLFRIAFSAQPGPQSLGVGWSVQFNTLDNGTARFDLTLFADIGDTALGLVFEYATDIVSEGVVARLAGLFPTTLDTVAARPETRLSGLVREQSDSGDGDASSAALQAVTEEWTKQLGGAPQSAHSDFFDVGGNSVHASRLITTARHRFGIDIAHTSALMQRFLEEPTVNGLAKGLTGLLGDDEGPGRPDTPSAHIDFSAESALPTDVEFPNPSPTPRHEPESILLTGANGFLGSNLLKEVLTRTQATVHCIVRAESRHEAESRIKAGLRDYGAMAAEDVDFGRVVAVPGDLATPRLGLSEANYEELAHGVDTIFHNGAWVNFVYPYEKLKDANVGGTTRMLRLAAAGRPKRLHYVSSQGVFSAQGFSGVTQVDESTRPTDPHHLFMGYVESKWVSEALLWQARERGLDVSVYRPHDIGGDSKTGRWKTNGFVCALIRSFVEIGAIPDYRLPLDLTPVDITARAVADLALRPQAAGSVFHLNNPRYAVVGDLEDQLNGAGHPVRMVSAREWDDLLLKHVHEHPDSVIAPFAHLFTERWTDQNLSVVDLYLEHRMPRIECSTTWDAVIGSDIGCPPGRRLLPLYIEYLDRIGFLGPRQPDQK